MASPSSVSLWIASLKAGDLDAAQALWTRYSTQLTQLALRKLGNAPKVVADEEDIALSVFRTVCRGAVAGRFSDVRNRDELWWLLLAITKQKVVDHVRRESAQKRGAGQVVHEGGLASVECGKTFSMDQVVGDQPTPDFLVMLEEQHARLLGLLRDDRLRQVAVSRIEGYTVPEIAAGLSISTRSVERKLQMIRKTWAQDFADVC